MEMGAKLLSDFSVDRAEREIAGWILSGHYSEGDQLPGLPELAEHFGISEYTVSKAIGRLKTRRLVHYEQGIGVVVNSLNEFVGLETLSPLLDHCGQRWRKFVVLCQFYDFIRPLLAEWAERAALRRSDTQLIWLDHYTSVLEGRKQLNCDRFAIGRAEYEIARVIAGAAENICFTMTVNALEDLYLSEMLVQGTDTIVPAEVYRCVFDAINARDGKRAAAVLEAALWKRETDCIAELKKLGWTATGEPLGAELELTTAPGAA